VADKTAQTIYIDAEPSAVMDVIADIASYPQWVSEYTEAEVLETDAKGNPKVARLVLEAVVLKDTMVIAYEWPADRQSVRWSLVSSTLLKSLDGVYLLTPSGSGTDVTYELAVDLVYPIPGFVKRRAEGRIIKTALSELKARVEGSPRPVDED
jgi:ribosome-associated toxin RatA of RatAB toxin-antitoxin module